MNLLCFLIIPLLAGCTYNVSIANAQGTNSDLIDDTQTPSTSVRADISAPVKVPGL